MRWRLIIEEFGPELEYIKGENNVVADALSCLENSPNQEILNISELYGYDDEDMPDSAYPIRYHDIAKAQETDAKLQQKIVSHKDYNLDTSCTRCGLFCEGLSSKVLTEGVFCSGIPWITEHPMIPFYSFLL